MTGCLIRALTEDDQPIWRALRLEALETEPTAFLTTAEEQRQRTTEQDRAGLAYGNWRGAFVDAELVALAALIPMLRAAAAHRMEVGAVYVATHRRGAGLARDMMSALEAEARERGARQLELEVSAINPRAIRFYERLGYERVGTKPRAIWTETGPVDDFAYVKFLDR